MREIKFRGISKGEFVYGNYVTDGDSYHAIVSPLNEHEMKNTPVDKETVGQFTGLQDINGVDIYESDVCNVEGAGNCLVVICKYYGVVFDDYNGHEEPLIDCEAELNIYNVIGNIHQHPELLEDNQ